ncbi:MAG: hypothetical protein LBB81_02785 [Treponema sp.]|jgi:hypothetical protein|nr:hypothetical protein [Treponema sp.]
MITTANRGWVADLETMTCRNANPRMVVEFHKRGETYIGKIRDIPVEIMNKWAKLWYGDYIIKNVVLEAQEVFLQAYSERDIENKNSSQTDNIQTKKLL